MKLEKDFGQYGGQYVPETLMTVLKVLEKEYEEYCFTDEFKNEFMYYMKEYVGRPSALTYCERLTKELGGAKVYLKREDLNHTGAHKINNALAQALLAKHMGKTKVIAETGAGQHGVATATVAALFGMECEVYMGVEDIERQKLNVFRMELLGAKVIVADTSTKYSTTIPILEKVEGREYYGRSATQIEGKADNSDSEREPYGYGIGKFTEDYSK